MTRVVSDQELKDGILSGVRKLNKAVADTLGPFGIQYSYKISMVKEELLRMVYQ